MLKKIFLLTILILIIPIMQLQICTAEDMAGYNEEEVVEIFDEKNNLLFSIAMGVTVGDRYISEDNIEYEIINVKGNKAFARKKSKVDLESELEASIANLPYLAVEETKSVGIYHTHNDESYQPGEISKEGPGDVHLVGRELAKALKKKDIKAIYSDNLHLPHDGAAYARSRSTALTLARENPDIIIDIHRDAVPNVNTYTANVKGENVTQIRLVVGRQNPNNKVNDQFARHLKAASDKITPGLIKDIFYGKGEYNQSIFPRAILMEFGTYGNNEKQALNAANLIATPISYLLYGGRGNKPLGSESEEKSALSNLFLIFILFGTGLFLYLYYIEGSFTGVKNRVKKFFTRELFDRRNK